MDDGRGHLIKKYYSLQSDCKNCPLRTSCISDKAKTKKVQHSIYKAELERAKARQQTIKAKVMKRKRSPDSYRDEVCMGHTHKFYRTQTLTCKGLSSSQQNVLISSHGLQPEEMVEVYCTQNKHKNYGNGANKVQEKHNAFYKPFTVPYFKPFSKSKFYD